MKGEKYNKQRKNTNKISNQTKGWAGSQQKKRYIFRNAESMSLVLLQPTPQIYQAQK